MSVRNLVHKLNGPLYFVDDFLYQKYFRDQKSNQGLILISFCA